MTDKQMVVLDEHGDTKYFSSLFRDIGINVRGFSSIEEGLPHLLENPYDLIFYGLFTPPGLNCDKIIPDIDNLVENDLYHYKLGLKVIRKIRSEESINEETSMILRNVCDDEMGMRVYQDLRERLSELNVDYIPCVQTSSFFIKKVKCLSPK